jgi:hypothetical protein
MINDVIVFPRAKYGGKDVILELDLARFLFQSCPFASFQLDLRVSDGQLRRTKPVELHAGQ